MPNESSEFRIPPPAPDVAEIPNFTLGSWWQVLRMATAEFVALMILCYVCTAYQGEAGLLGGALSGGLTLTLLIWGSGPISGGHVNPAVTFYFFLTRRLSVVHTIMYWVAQVLGGALGSFLALSLMPEEAASTGVAGMTIASDKISTGQVFGLELIGTFVLVGVVAVGCDELRGSTELWSIASSVGFTVIAQALCIGPLTGGSLNPARSLGPAFVNKRFDNIWIYIVAPMCGSLIATLLQEFVLNQDASFARSKLLLTKWQFDRTCFHGKRGGSSNNDGSKLENSKNVSFGNSNDNIEDFNFEKSSEKIYPTKLKN